MKILSFKMVGGEEIIARVNGTKEVNGTIISYDVENPMTIMVGQRGLALLPWTLSNPDISSLPLPASSIIVSFNPAEDIEKEFMRQTSKIAIA